MWALWDGVCSRNGSHFWMGWGSGSGQVLGILRGVCGVVGARASEGTVLSCGGVHVRRRCRIADEEGRIAEASGAPATASSLLESGNIKKLLSVRWVTCSPIARPRSCR